MCVCVSYMAYTLHTYMTYINMIYAYKNICINYAGLLTFAQKPYLLIQYSVTFLKSSIKFKEAVSTEAFK